MKIAIKLILLFLSTKAFALVPSQVAEEAVFDSVVTFYSPDVDENGDSVPAFCNGVLISPTEVISAAHCVIGAEALGKREIDLQLGNYRYRSREGEPIRRIGYANFHRQTIKVKYVFTPELTNKIRRQGRRTRIGVAEDQVRIILQEPLNLANAPTVALVTTAQERQALKARVTSYAPRVVTVNWLETLTHMDTRQFAHLDKLSASGGAFESKSVGRVQPGDSGAPVFVRIGSEWKLIAVVKGRAETFFSNWDVYPILDQRLFE